MPAQALRQISYQGSVNEVAPRPRSVSMYSTSSIYTQLSGVNGTAQVPQQPHLYRADSFIEPSPIPSLLTPLEGPPRLELRQTTTGAAVDTNATVDLPASMWVARPSIAAGMVGAFSFAPPPTSMPLGASGTTAPSPELPPQPVAPLIVVKKTKPSAVPTVDAKGGDEQAGTKPPAKEKKGHKKSLSASSAKSGRRGSKPRRMSLPKGLFGSSKEGEDSPPSRQVISVVKSPTDLAEQSFRSPLPFSPMVVPIFSPVSAPVTRNPTSHTLKAPKSPAFSVGSGRSNNTSPPTRKLTKSRRHSSNSARAAAKSPRQKTSPRGSTNPSRPVISAPIGPSPLPSRAKVQSDPLPLSNQVKRPASLRRMRANTAPVLSHGGWKLFGIETSLFRRDVHKLGHRLKRSVGKIVHPGSTTAGAKGRSPPMRPQRPSVVALAMKNKPLPAPGLETPDAEAIAAATSDELRNSHLEARLDQGQVYDPDEEPVEHARTNGRAFVPPAYSLSAYFDGDDAGSGAATPRAAGDEEDLAEPVTPGVTNFNDHMRGLSNFHRDQGIFAQPSRVSTEVPFAQPTLTDEGSLPAVQASAIPLSPSLAPASSGKSIGRSLSWKNRIGRSPSFVSSLGRSPSTRSRKTSASAPPERPAKSPGRQTKAKMSGAPRVIVSSNSSPEGKTPPSPASWRSSAPVEAPPMPAAVPSPGALSPMPAPTPSPSGYSPGGEYVVFGGGMASPGVQAVGSAFANFSFGGAGAAVSVPSRAPPARMDTSAFAFNRKGGHRPARSS